MLVIRLARTGKKHQAYFRIVVAEKRRAVGAKFIEILGNYDPHAKKFSIDSEKLQKYLKDGAQPSNTVAKLLKAEKISLPKWVKIAEKNKASKQPVEEPKEAPKAAAEAEEPKVETESADSAETPAEATEEPKEEAKEAEQTEAPAEVTEEKAAEEGKE